MSGSDSIYDHELIFRLDQLVTTLELVHRDFVIFGSGPLLAHGLRQCIRDVDVVARGESWQRVSSCGLPAVGDINGAPMAEFWGGRIQFSSGWISKEWDIDGLIDQAEIIQGLPFAKLTDVLAYKKRLCRPKDHQDIDALESFLDKGRRLDTEPSDRASAPPPS